MGAPRSGTPEAALAEEHLAELGRLADTAGAEVVGELIQRVDAPDPRSYIRSGKLEVLRDMLRANDANLVIFDEELSPAQGKNLEGDLKVRTMDRSELILDIFATRARSNEARLQVELAQLEYLLPRLARMWVHLSRIRGGIGLRGPGETQIETDRRLIRTRIAKLRKKLEKVARHREVLRSGRRNVLTTALVGYTNAGKSSLLRAVTGAEAFVEDRLFATLDTLVRETALPEGRVRMIDTVGFIRKLPHHLVASFRSTLEEAGKADLLLHVVDASHPSWEEQVRSVDTVLSDLGVSDIKTIVVFNKMDLVEHQEDFEVTARGRFPGAIFVSARTKDLDELREALTRELVRRFQRTAKATPNAGSESLS